MDFSTAKGLEFLLIFGVILGGCVYQLYAVERDARLGAERRKREKARDTEAVPRKAQPAR